eukprot:TRINITY_DN859_c0_g6_i1.p1 TRINITY_DN859_c0_g6~~TRINITY_DN859_c0_g6_i1.p1  ORF type:complete len:240 (+),score=65.22 TRINITY_DN859_c0_g6_i1:55-774(+)
MGPICSPWEQERAAAEEALESSSDACPDVFDFVGSDEEDDEFAGWGDVTVGRYTLRLPVVDVMIWDSSVMMGEHILAHPEMVAGKVILELGSGIGIPSFCAALAGAKEVVGTDLSPVAIARLNQAVRCNAEAYPQLNVLRGKVLDWFKPEAAGLAPFETIIAADVNYERCLTEPLTHTINAHLLPDAPFYLASRTGRVSLADSLESLQQHVTLMDTTLLHESEDKQHFMYTFRGGPARA